MVLEGTIEDIIFRNDENGYTVAELSHGDEYTTIVGKFLKINVGETVRLTGDFVSNQKYGEQFSFTTSEIIYPSSVDGIKKYLSSGLIKGVGKVTAEAIVNRFGEQTFEVMEFSPHLLANIRGISNKKAIEIGKAFSELKRIQNSVIFLQQYNISTNMALKIYAIYQEKTVELVKENPYRLVEEVDGIGFLTADKIAQSMGVNENSAFRFRAGMLHILKENSDKNGNTYIPKEVLFNNVAVLLNLPVEEYREQFVMVLDNLCFDKVTTMLFKKPQEIVMLTKMYFVESAVAQKLALLNYEASTLSIDVSSPIAHFERLNKIEFDISQKQAIVTAVKNGVTVITGGPGTGKTTIVKCIINILKQQKYKVMLLAPTGRAAKRLSESTGEEAKTIHRGLEIDFRGDNGRFVHNENNPLDVDAVIVDEVSMVDVNLMNALLKALPRDCKLVLVGDKDQLPSVGAGNVLDDILKSKVISVSYLTKIFRQDEHSLIISNAHKINEG
ncbi:MAG: AAA family ATPase, partial [Clostridia bacterium]|nr:AAA family ATPase [Clostridia bacterium]